MRRRQIEMSKYYILVIIFILGLISGSLFANLYYGAEISKLGVFDYSFIEKMQRLDLQFNSMFSYVATQRLKIWLLTTCLSLTFMGIIVYYGTVAVSGFLMGVLSSAIVAIHGIPGILYYLFLCMIPQIIFLVGMMIGIHNGIAIRQKKFREALFKSVLFYLMSLAVVAISCLAETVIYLNFASYFYKY